MAVVPLSLTVEAALNVPPLIGGLVRVLLVSVCVSVVLTTTPEGKLLREGRDPRMAAKRAKLVGYRSIFQTFEQAAREWHAVQKPQWKPVHANGVITSFERDIFPHLGTMPMDEIDQPLLLAVLRKIEDRGAIETTRRIKQRVAAIYRYVNAHGARLDNPANDFNDALAPLPPSKRYPALLRVDTIKTMLGDVDRAGASPTAPDCVSASAYAQQQRPDAALRHCADRAGADQHNYPRRPCQRGALFAAHGAWCAIERAREVAELGQDCLPDGWQGGLRRWARASFSRSAAIRRRWPIMTGTAPLQQMAQATPPDRPAKHPPHPLCS